MENDDKKVCLSFYLYPREKAFLEEIAKAQERTASTQLRHYFLECVKCETP